MKTYRFKIYGHQFETKVVRRTDEEVVFTVNGQEYKAYLEPMKKRTFARPAPKVERPVAVPKETPKITAPPDEAKGAGVVKAPLPGLILKVTVKPGDTVKVGDTVCIMEAMKMQNNIAATVAGTVREVKVKEGDSILEGQELLTITKA